MAFNGFEIGRGPAGNQGPEVKYCAIALLFGAQIRHSISNRKFLLFLHNSFGAPEVPDSRNLFGAD